MADSTSSSSGLVGNVKDLIGQANAAATTRKPGNDLSKDAFLQLLVSQLKNQDPLNPMDNTQFISQMAQFSSLEQMQNLNQTMSAQANFQSLTNASGMIGKYVSLADSSDGTGSGLITGQVSEIRQAGNSISVIVGGKAYDASTIEQVSASPITSTDAQAAAAASKAAAATAAAASTGGALTSAATNAAISSAASQATTGSTSGLGALMGTGTSNASPAASALTSAAAKTYSLQGLKL